MGLEISMGCSFPERLQAKLKSIDLMKTQRGEREDLRAESWNIVSVRGWERAEELVGGQERNSRDGGREVGRRNVMEI